MSGVKHDADKAQWHLLVWGCVRDVVNVMTFGAKKYGANNWQQVPYPRERYFSAAMRHLAEWESGVQKDAESGLPVLAHAICCLMFLWWFERPRGGV